MSVNKKHIVYTISSLKRTGPNEVLNSMLRNIDLESYRVTVVTFLRSDVIYKSVVGADSSIKYVHFDMSRKLDIALRGHKALRGALMGTGVDIIHSHGILPDIASYRSKIASAYISTVHANIREDYRYAFGRLKGLVIFFGHISYLRKFNRIINCSKTSFAGTKRYLPNSKPISNGAEVTKSKSLSGSSSRIRQELGIARNDVVYIYVGKLSRRKNVIALLESFSLLSNDNEHLIVLGDGELRERCSLYASSNVHLLGFKSNTNDFLDASDIYVSASKSEGFSISVVEALGRGLHLLLSDIPSHREVFEIDEAVYIGEVYKSHDFKNAKIRLADNISSREVPTAFYHRYLTADIMMRRYEAVYLEILK